MKEQSGGTSVSIESSETIDRPEETTGPRQSVFCDSDCCFPAYFPMSMLICAVDLGKLILISNEDGFSSHFHDTEDGPGHELLKHHKSSAPIKALLREVVGVERKAFDSAKETMCSIGNDAQRIQQTFQNVFAFCKNPTKEFSAQHLKTELEEVQKAVQNCDALCKKTAEDLTVVIDTVKEIKAETNSRLTTREEMAIRRIIIRIYLWIQAIINWLIRRWIGPMRSDEHANVVLAEAGENQREAQKRNDELLEEKTGLIDQLTEINAEPEQGNNEEKIDYAQIEDLLSDDLTALVNYHKGWCKLATFFQNIEEVVTQSLKWSDELVDVKDQGAGDTIGKIKQLFYESFEYAVMIIVWCSAYARIVEHVGPIFHEFLSYPGKIRPADVSMEFSKLEQMEEEARDNIEKEMKPIDMKFRQMKEVIQRGTDCQGTEGRAESDERNERNRDEMAEKAQDIMKEVVMKTTEMLEMMQRGTDC